MKLVVVCLMNCTSIKMIADHPDLVKSRLECLYSGAEKVFLHLNKDAYVSGEEVLFKAYLVNGGNFKPDTICKVLYIALKNCNNQKIVGFRINLSNGTGHGFFTLPDTLTTGNYYVTAFTNNMRNFSHDLYFASRIIVSNQMDDKLEKMNTDEFKNEDSVQFSFYPESGKLLADIDNRVVFLGSNIPDEFQNLPVEIFNDSLRLITSAQVNKAGIGEFSFTPDKGKKYVARFNNKAYSIGPVVNEGYALKAIFNDMGGINVIVRANFGVDDSQTLHLVCHTRGLNIVDKKFVLHNGLAFITLSANVLGKGITHLSLLNSSLELICERLVYIPENVNKIDLGLEPYIYGTRQKVGISVSISQKYLSSGTISLSASVSQKLPVSGSKNFNNNISNYLSFFSNTRIKNSAFLFGDSLINKRIDQFLITQHNQQNSWENTAENPKPLCQSLPETHGYIVSGKVLTKTNEPLSRVCVYLSVPDSFVNLKYCYSDTNGRFFFRLSKFYDNKNLVFQVKNVENPGDVKLEIDDKFNDEIANHGIVKDIPFDLRNFMMQSRTIALVNKVYKPFLLNLLPNNYPDQNKSNYNFYGIPNEIIYLSDYSELANFNEIVKNILPGVYYTKTGNTHKIRIVDLGSQILWPNEALVFLNNIPFPDPVFISKLDTRQIKKIELKKSHLLYGDLDIYGIISITTNQKNIYALDARHTSLVFPNAVNDVRIAISGPDYGENTITTENIPDFRQTLYWDPEIKLNNGQATIEFYTSDIKGVYTVELEGITSEGIPLTGQAFIEVK